MVSDQAAVELPQLISTMADELHNIFDLAVHLRHRIRFFGLVVVSIFSVHYWLLRADLTMS